MLSKRRAPWPGIDPRCCTRRLANFAAPAGPDSDGRAAVEISLVSSWVYRELAAWLHAKALSLHNNALRECELAFGRSPFVVFGDALDAIPRIVGDSV